MSGETHPLKTLALVVPIGGLFHYAQRKSLPVLLSCVLIEAGYVASIMELNKGRHEANTDVMSRRMKLGWGESFASSAGLTAVSAAGLFSKPPAVLLTSTSKLVRFLPYAGLVTGALGMYYAGTKYLEWKELDEEV